MTESLLWVEVVGQGGSRCGPEEREVGRLFRCERPGPCGTGLIYEGGPLEAKRVLGVELKSVGSSGRGVGEACSSSKATFTF